VRDRRWMVHGKTERDIAAAVVPGHGEMVMPERAHQRQAITGHRPLGVRRMISSRRGLRRFPVAPQIGAHDRMRPGQQGRDPVPRHVGTRMTVQKQHRWARSAITHPQDNATEIDTAECEAREHVLRHLDISLRKFLIKSTW
jgi:hypothetical protein